MDYIKNIKGEIVIAIDDTKLYYLFSNAEEYSELNEEEIKSLFINNETAYLELKYLQYDNGYKFSTILDLLIERELITKADNISEKIKRTNHIWNQLIANYEESVHILSNRIVLLEMEGSGPASAWNDTLFLIGNEEKFDLCSTRLGYLSAVERIEYYGLKDSEYWDSILVNGESIEGEIDDIKSAEILQNGIVSLLGNDEQWDISENKIDWRLILNSMLEDERTKKLGAELESIVFKTLK